MMLSLSRVVLLCACMGQCFSANWGYGDDNNNWGELFQDTKCNEKREDDKKPKQSPINIETENANGKDNMDKFNYEKWGEVEKMTVKNNGHTVVCSIHSTVETTGGGLGATFKLAQFHFHWGSDSMKGSEHTIDGNAFPMEVHFVHYNTKYGTIGDALPKSDGLAVLGFMFKISETDNPAMKPIVDVMLANANVKRQTEETMTVEISMSANQFLPAGESVYYGYNGSLTTPTCDESVAWRVFETPISISEAQMAKFRELQDGHEHKIVDNFRPVQDLNGRKVWSATSAVPGKPVPTGPKDAGVSLNACLVTMVTCVLSAMFGLSA